MKSVSVLAASAAAFAAIFAGHPASADEPVHLAPSSPWQLRYDKEACRLSRTFGEGEQTVLLTLAKYRPDTEIEFLIAGAPLLPDGKRLAYRLEPVEEAESKLHAMFGTADDGQTVWQFVGQLIPESVLAHVDGDSAPQNLKRIEAEFAERAHRIGGGTARVPAHWQPDEGHGGNGYLPARSCQKLGL